MRVRDFIEEFATLNWALSLAGCRAQPTHGGDSCCCGGELCSTSGSTRITLQDNDTSCSMCIICTIHLIRIVYCVILSLIMCLLRVSL